ncbi:hypothetical protein [Plantactinospora endophytica]|uniref:DivIVA domain-containing protein n=1 Tax=Plantactinospora endophytica TaxID=673535 RepID=A0ABQ4EFC8_9ACTN|nr:hypothetical protein [Plantactinospora endophytica]GIG93389.1 hypothetical protein Pen02_83250 [Plantactinospora endophytica]
MVEDPDLTVVLRGYDRGEVQELTRRAVHALASDSPAERAAVAEELRRPVLTVRLRGYDREQVERHLGALVERLTTG